MLPDVRTFLALALALTGGACGSPDTSGGEPDVSGACGQTFGDGVDNEAQAAANACSSDPAGVGCDPAALLTREAAMCAAKKVDDAVDWRGSLFHDKLAHRTVWKMHGSLAQSAETGAPHSHILLDARSGDPLAMQNVSRRDSSMKLVEADGSETQIGEFSGGFLLAGDRIESFDARAGKQYAEAYKIGARSLTPTSGNAFDVDSTILAGNDTLEVKFAAEITVEGGVARLQAEVPVGDKRLVMDLVGDAGESSK